MPQVDVKSVRVTLYYELGYKYLSDITSVLPEQTKTGFPI